MSWERRKGKGEYYTRCRRVNGRVVREYVGTGMKGALAAATDLMRRKLRQIERDQRKAQEAQWQAADDRLGNVCQAADRLAQATLMAAGYRQQAKTEWHRRRVIKSHKPDGNEFNEGDT